MSLAKCTATGNNLISTESTQIFIGGCNREIGGHGNSSKWQFNKKSTATSLAECSFATVQCTPQCIFPSTDSISWWVARIETHDWVAGICQSWAGSLSRDWLAWLWWKLLDILGTCVSFNQGDGQLWVRGGEGLNQYKKRIPCRVILNILQTLALNSKIEIQLTGWRGYPAVKMPSSTRRLIPDMTKPNWTTKYSWAQNVVQLSW